MFLKSLTLKGFKSFADATTLLLEPGVTVVVGPNGSGKSNVVDAIAWVLGAQAPKSVRSQKMDDVIFAGTASRPALGRAEVAITIDNSDNTLDVELSEITITRTLFRSGDSEYSINGVGCRLLDVQELLSDAGVGRQQHAIVSQGQIDAVLNARPEDRRAIIEEAAGVLKYRKRKEKAERRLDATEANLLRVQDLLREVRRQLRPLERQAKAAGRHEELIGELTALRTYVSGREIAGLRVKLEALAGTRIESEGAERDHKRALAALDTDVMSIEAELSARGASDVGDRLARVEQLRERARGLLAVLAERRRSLERDRGQLLDAGVVATLEADTARFRAELETVDAELATIAPAAQQLDTEEEAFRDQREIIRGAAGSDLTMTGAASAVAEVRGELRSVRASYERAHGLARHAGSRGDALRRRVEAVDTEIAHLRIACDDAGEVEAPLVVEVEAAERELATAEADLETARARRQDCAEEASRWSARAEALEQALDASRARAGAEHLDGVSGVLGTLLDLIEIDSGWERAVEAALGESLTAVVVENPSAARRALAALRRSETSGAVLALGSARSAPPTKPKGETVRSHARAGRRDVDELLDILLAGAIRVADVDAAIEASIAAPDTIVVTESGDRFGSAGWRVGAAGSGATAAALDEAVTQAQEAARELKAASATAESATAEVERARRQEHDVVRRLDTNDAQFTAASEALGRALGDKRELSAEMETIETTVADTASNVEREGLRISELEALLPALESDERAEADAERGRERTRAELEARAALLASRRKDHEVRNAGLIERRQLLDGQLTDVEARLAADAEARRAAAGQREQVERSLAAIDRLETLVKAHRGVVEIHHGELAEQRRQHSDIVKSLTSRLDTLRHERTHREGELDATRERARRAELDEAEARLRLETAVETVRRDLDIEPEAAEASPMPEIPDGATPAGRVRELERELRLLGPINPLALEEFNELETRHAFLEEQLEDVRTTRRDLARVIAAVDREIQSVFAAAFADVSENFTHLFGLLFPGGKGALKLTAPDDLLDTGIEIEAKPSGKNVKKLSLLSGGERSLTALAYLFAVFRSRPSPFYVMDEVEAALDDVNLHRFLGLVDEFRKDAQLVIVSHQKRTMEAGDCLLGVSMQPGGSSKVVSERTSESSLASDRSLASASH